MFSRLNNGKVDLPNDATSNKPGMAMTNHIEVLEFLYITKQRHN